MSHIRRFAQYVAYITAFSLLYPLSGLATESIAHLAGYPGFRSGHLSPRFLSGALWVVPYATCQVIAAGITVRGLSLRNLLWLSCLFALISHALSALDIRLVMAQSGLSVVSTLMSITVGSLDHNDHQEGNIDRYGGGGPKSRWPNRVTWPPTITRLNPGYVDVGKTEDGQPKIRLTWGGGFGHWGIEIGPEDMEVPQTLERKGQEFGPPDHRYTVYDTGEYRLPFAPGAYVWYEIQ